MSQKKAIYIQDSKWYLKKKSCVFNIIRFQYAVWSKFCHFSKIQQHSNISDFTKILKSSNGFKEFFMKFLHENLSQNNNDL